MNQPTISESSKSQVIALAAMLQCCNLVDQIATLGTAPIDNINTSINSLFQFNAQNAADIYGGANGVALGLNILLNVLSNHNSKNNSKNYADTVRYGVGLVYLQKKLSAKPEMLTIIRGRLEHAEQYEHFTDDVNNIHSSIAAIYQDTISTFKFRIQINGSALLLQNTVNANTIRALLLAGIRACVLWRQSGGSRWQLFFAKKRLLETTTYLLKQCH